MGVVVRCAGKGDEKSKFYRTFQACISVVVGGVREKSVRVPFYEWVKECIFYFKSSLIEEGGVGGELCAMLLCREFCFVLFARGMGGYAETRFRFQFFQKNSPIHPLPSSTQQYRCTKKVFCYR